MPLCARLCESDYRYEEYLTSPSSQALLARGQHVFSQAEFDRRDSSSSKLCVDRSACVVDALLSRSLS